MVETTLYILTLDSELNWILRRERLPEINGNREPWILPMSYIFPPWFHRHLLWVRDWLMKYSFFNSNKYGFEGLISAPSALKIFEIHKVFLQIFALTERKSSPSKLLRIWNAIDYVQSGISSLQAYFRMSKRKMPECAWDIVFQTYSIAVKKTIITKTEITHQRVPPCFR